MEVTKKSIISSQNYCEIKNMMLSNDDASKKIALTILEQSDFELSQVYVLCILKETFSEAFEYNSTELEKDYKKITKVLKGKKETIATLSFKNIYELSVNRKVEEEMKFLLNIFKEELITLLKDYGFTFLEYLDVNITQKIK